LRYCATQGSPTQLTGVASSLEATAAPVADAPSLSAADDVSIRAAALAHPETLGTQIQWAYAVAFVIMHALACLALVPYTFSWLGVALVPLGNYLFCSLGIGLCFHRMLTHRGLVTPKWLEYATAICGVCTLMESPARWVATHRLHHQHSDERPDPHSPLVGFLWGHFQWLLVENRFLSTADFYDRYARDLLRDPFYMFFERHLWWLWTYLIHAVLLAALGFGIGWFWTYEGLSPLESALRLAASFFVWGVVVRTIYSWHITWGVNSLAHLSGYRNYETSDNSRNNWLIALTTNGEGWHNNHHADQRAAAHGHRWWEMDVTWWTICGLERVGLATDVVRPKEW
jgi:stearoyl-CoA desaturase (delta-9 desaturase)